MIMFALQYFYIFFISYAAYIKYCICMTKGPNISHEIN